MPSIREIAMVSIATMGVMFLANQLASMNPKARRFLKGSSVSATNDGAGTGVRSV